MLTKRSESPSCRRLGRRAKFESLTITYWSDWSAPRRVAAIEVDEKGARIVFPDRVEAGEFVTISVTNSLGHSSTRMARIAWVHKLEVVGKTVAGIQFGERLACAA